MTHVDMGVADMGMADMGMADMGVADMGVATCLAHTSGSVLNDIKWI